MSEATDQTAPASEPAQEPVQSDSANQPLGEGGEKALKAEREARKAAEKAAADLKAKLDAIEQANLSELEKAQKAAQDAAAKLAEFERTTLRQKVALDKGVPAKWVDRLKGDTEAELAADAEAILADLAPGKTTPRPDLSQGGKGTPAKGSTAEQFAQAFNDALN